MNFRTSQKWNENLDLTYTGQRYRAQCLTFFRKKRRPQDLPETITADVK